jgi:hypothetical protein
MVQRTNYGIHSLAEWTHLAQERPRIFSNRLIILTVSKKRGCFSTSMSNIVPFILVAFSIRDTVLWESWAMGLVEVYPLFQQAESSDARVETQSRDLSTGNGVFGELRANTEYTECTECTE